MKPFVTILLFTIACCLAKAQSADAIIKDGVALHDAGKYKEAIANTMRH